MADDLYIRTLEKDAERNNKIFSKIGELVDEGVYLTSPKALRQVLKEIGQAIGLHMADIDDDDESGFDIWRSSDEEWEDLYDD